jgi:phosphatidylserine/phosphatidylglycerophosphate/cardiolipin synthase-like enzyme
MAAPLIQTTFLRDKDHGGAKTQPRTVAGKLAAFIAKATGSVDIAIYDFRLSDPTLISTVVGALSTAAANGITVRIAYDAGKPAAASEKTFALMAADPAPPGTAQWVAEHFNGTGVQTKAITAPSGQLMHSKYVLLDAVAGGKTAAVWTGSTNFTDDAWTLQENNIITFRSAGLAMAYRQDFDQLWAAGAIKGTGAGVAGAIKVGQANVRYDFAPGDGSKIDAALVTAIAVARTRIVTATMVLTSRTVLQAIVDAIGRGVPVSGMYDAGQMDPIEREWTKSGSANSLAALHNWQQVKTHLTPKHSTPYTPDGPHDFMHNKILIADDQLVTGSYNFSANAEKNAENQLHVVTSATIVERYAAYIETIAVAYQ